MEENEVSCACAINSVRHHIMMTLMLSQEVYVLISHSFTAGNGSKNHHLSRRHRFEQHANTLYFTRSLLCLPWVGLTSETFHNQASAEQNSVNSTILPVNETEIFHHQSNAEQNDNAIETSGELQIPVALGTDPEHDDLAAPSSSAAAEVKLDP